MWATLLYRMLPSWVLIAGGIILFYEGVPLGPLRDVPVLGPAVATLVDGRVDRERTAALKGYVLQSEKDALAAQLTEIDRQRRAAEAARSTLEKELAELARKNSAELADLEKDISDYEAKLATSGRGCRLDDADIDWLQRDGS